MENHILVLLADIVHDHRAIMNMAMPFEIQYAHHELRNSQKKKKNGQIKKKPDSLATWAKSTILKSEPFKSPDMW